MSLRALKKRELENCRKQQQQQYQNVLSSTSVVSKKPLLTVAMNRKRSKSLPNLTKIISDNENYIGTRKWINYSPTATSLNGFIKFLSKSDTDIHKLQNYTNNNENCINLLNAKSEICLKTILVHKTASTNSNLYQKERSNSNSSLQDHHHHHHHNNNHHYNPTVDVLNNNSLNYNSYNSNSDYHQHKSQQQQSQHTQYFRSSSPIPRRSSGHLSICSSNRSNSIYDSGNSSNNAVTLANIAGSRRFIDTTCILHIPIIGYEVMEERARFTVYKLRVGNPFTNDCWLVLRRYTDFVRLNTKLKQLFPSINLQLPRKKLFGDNFNAVFLDNRVQGLQMYINSIMSKDELRNSKIVRDFFCLDEPPIYSESMEECRAIFEAQEETISHLKMQVNSKNDIILSLQQRLANEISEKNKYKLAIRNIATECTNCSYLLSNLGISLQSTQNDQKCDK